MGLAASGDIKNPNPCKKRQHTGQRDKTEMGGQRQPEKTEGEGAPTFPYKGDSYRGAFPPKFPFFGVKKTIPYDTRTILIMWSFLVSCFCQDQEKHTHNNKKKKKKKNE